VLKLRRRPRTVLCTIATGPHRELFQVAQPGLEQLAAGHGYQMVVVHDDDISAGRPPPWGKVRLLRRLLDTHDRVVWVDSDAVVVDPSGDIFEGVDRRTPLSLVVHRYDGLEIPNTGVMAFLSCRWSKELLDRLWAAEGFIDHKWWENAAMIELLGYEVDDPRASTRRANADSRRIHELDLSWNSIPINQSPTPRIVHFPGMTQSERLTGMRAALRAASADATD
jgi:hypothetical protein